MEDLIRRSDAIEAIRKLPNAGFRWFVSAEAVFDVLLTLPSADRPQGEWIVDEEQGTSTCSNCGIRWQFTDGTNGSNFCPNCGADMREVRDE